MLTDWVLIGRLSEELRQRLGGARLEDAGLLADGRLGLLFRRRGARLLLAIDLFASPPNVTLEDGELGIGNEPSFVRAVARSLRAMILADVASRRNDRLLRLTFSARSRFGVGDRLDLYLELVPRFGNAVLVKDETVVAAYKEFALAENPRRAVQAGTLYALPPLPENPRTLASQPPGSALDFFAEMRAQQSARAGSERNDSRRQALLKRLGERERKLRSELASVDDRRRQAERRKALRAEGEDIFATLHSLDDREQDAAKARAGELFAEYKKLAKSLPHLESRDRTLRASLEAVETLCWETERAGDDDLDAVEAAVAELGPKRGARDVGRPPKRKRALLEFRTPHGSRILVGRSPVENAELTFRVARPNDLWFHAQGIPGAHVILARDDRTPPPEEDLSLAASLAAFYSRAKTSTTAPIDYTLRKHVRKQRSAPPGLVWYTQAKTILAEPKPLAALVDAPR
ncbi:MAG: NFACT RNA binding domain-containing protein [Candidatus Cybelea sp.]